MSRKRKVVADEEEDPTKVEFETSEEVDVVPTFDQLKLREDLLRGVYAYGKVMTVNALTHMGRLNERHEGAALHCSSLYYFLSYRF